ncbi:MAG: DNA-binding response regulator [Flavobacteriales bacterium]|nr:MAG: DNA-binding response regulator [Flavobacteriales bacterium]
MIRVLITDDHQMFIDGIKALLVDSEEVHVVAMANNGEEALDRLKKQPIDVVIMDINMPVMNGIEATKQIREKYPDVKVLALTMYIEKELITEIVKAGATGYILKNTGKEELITAITTIAKGEKFYSSDVALKMLDAKTTLEYVEDIDNQNRNINLTKREKEILKLITMEYTTPQIAEKLLISYFTVETHRKNLIRKLNVKNVAGLVKIAIQNGLVD